MARRLISAQVYGPPWLTLTLTLTLTLALIASGCGAGSSSTPPVPDDEEPTFSFPHQRQLNMPPRRQWLANYGYCGEVSLISAGLLHGQYISQFDARDLASPGVPQASMTSQLLLGVNDAAAATAMRLKAEVYDPKAIGPRAFLTWIKGQVVRGFPVVIGVYMNHERFDDGGAEYAGDKEYDHIVPVLGVESKSDLADGAYHGDDRLLLSDNGLWGDPEDPPGKFAFTFDSMPKSRQEANEPDAAVYALPKEGANYGVAITGILDEDGQHLPVQLTTDTDLEPAMADGGSLRPGAMPVTLQVTVEGLTPGVDYRLYRYGSVAKVPLGKFNGQAGLATQSSTIQISSGTTYQVTQVIQSSETAIFRVVPATAP